MSFKKNEIYQLVAGVVCIALASLVIYGWYSQNQTYIQIHKNFAPMQYNTALGFLLCGMALIGITINKSIFVRIMGALVFILGTASLSQYLFSINLGIDELFVKAIYNTKTSHPGRPSPITSFCFALCGITLLSVKHKRGLVVSASIAALLLSLISIIGYFFPQDGLYGWGNLTRMAIHTAVGFIVVSSAIIAYFVLPSGRDQFDYWQIVPFSVAVIMAILTSFSWYAIEEEATARNQAHLQSIIKDTQNVIQERYNTYEQSLYGGLGLYYASSSVSRQEWRAYVNTLKIEENLPGISGIGYIDYVLSENLSSYLEKVRADDAPYFKNHPDTFYPDKFIIKFIEPEKQNAKAVGLDIGFEANRRAAAERARDLGVPALTKKILLVQDDKKQAGFLLLLPRYRTQDVPPTIEERRKLFLGWVYAPFIGPNFFTGINQVNNNQLNFSVYDGKKRVEEALIYVSSFSNVDVPSEKVITSMQVAGRTWVLEWYPNENYAPPADKNFGIFLLSAGMIFSVLLYFAISMMLRSKEIIQEKVDERTNELNQINQELLRSNNELQRFAYIASHDLQEPLRKIGGFTERIELHFADQMKDDEVAKKYMSFVTDGVNRMRELVSGLLSYAQITSSEAKLEEVDANLIVADAAESLSELILENDVEISYIDLPTVLHDKVMLTQLFQNLISNAIKYRSDKAPRIKITAKKDKKYWQFSIEDNGMGMDQKYLERIFEMFQRLHRKEEIAGTGIGLSLCQKIVERYGGKMWVTSEPEVGSTFFFTIPIQK